MLVGGGTDYSIVMHDLYTLLLPPNIELCEDCARTTEPSRTAEISSGQNLGEAGEADAIGQRSGRGRDQGAAAEVDAIRGPSSSYSRRNWGAAAEENAIGVQQCDQGATAEADAIRVQQLRQMRSGCNS